MRAADLEGTPDDQLFRAFAQDRDQDALEVLLRRHHGRVYGLALRILRDASDAEEASQEVWITVFRKARSFRQESSLTTWLYRITVNACNDLIRRNRRAPVPVEELPATASFDGMPDDRIAIEEALEKLPVDQRTAVVLRDLYGLSYDEIGSVTGVPAGTVKSRIARGRAAMAGILTEPPAETDRLTDRGSGGI